MSLYLLDANIVSDLVRNPAGIVARRIGDVGEKSVCTSVIVAAELRFGAAKKGSDRLARQLEGTLLRLDVRAFEPPADNAYGDLRANLEARGTPIGALDTLIAAHALALGCIVVTANEREFRRVDGLAVENWLT